jgi:manganese/zinc/iron transport system permease protein
MDRLALAEGAGVSWDLQIGMVAVAAGIACPLAGVFLILRRMAMMADAISHSVLPGLVAAYALAQGPNLAAGLVGAISAGLATVLGVELMVRSRLVRDDAAIGIAFPAMFALGVMLVTSRFSGAHLDADAVLYGEIALAPAEAWTVGGAQLGPQAFWLLVGAAAVNALVLALFYKELKITTFDPGLAAALGFAPAALHAALMAMTAATTVSAFSAVGAVLAVAMIIVPPAAARLLTDRLPAMIALSCLIGAGSALAGFWIALAWNVSISGMMAACAGAAFLLCAAAAPQRGILAAWARRRRQKLAFQVEMLLMHLAAHREAPGEEAEGSLLHIERELEWSPERLSNVVRRAERAGLLQSQGGMLELTSAGMALHREMLPWSKVD